MEVKTITVVGAGAMGRGIALAAAAAGYSTVLEDISGQMLDAALAEIRAYLDEGVGGGQMTGADGEATLARIRPETVLHNCVRGADLVIEAVPEDMETKIEVFTQLDQAAPPHTIFASTSSSLSVTELASVTYRSGQFLGMHFLPPAHKTRLLELVRALETSEQTLEAVEAAGRRMGRETVRVRESPGLITSRMEALIANEAFCLLQEGVASAADIDKALKLGLNHPRGPFEQADLVGLDTRLHTLESLHGSLGEKFRPCPLLSQYVKAGRLGRKAGRGVYEYNVEGGEDVTSAAKLAGGSAGSRRDRESDPGKPGS